MKKLVSASLLAAGLALAGVVQAAPVTLLNVSYDVMRDFYKDYNAAFQKRWAAEHPNDKLTLQMSFGGSSKQARSVIDGLPADVITMNMATDINALADNGKLVPDNWVTRLPNNSAPFTSATVFIVRKGNPKALKDWPDLLKDGVRTGASARNWASYGVEVDLPVGLEDWRRDLLTDPQTSGGLLIAAAEAEVRDLEAFARINGSGFDVVGRVVEGPPRVRVAA